MITICTYDPFTHNIAFKECTVSKEIESADDDILIEHVFSVEATDADLLYIARRFQNLPMGPQYGSELKITWFGDHAKFIVANIKL